MHLVRADWREAMDQIATIIEDVRSQFQRALGLDEDLIHYHHRYPFFDWRLEQAMGEHFRGDVDLDDYMNERRREAIALMNVILSEMGYPPLSIF